MMLAGKKIKNDKIPYNPGVGQMAHLLKCWLCMYEEELRSIAHVKIPGHISSYYNR